MICLSNCIAFILSVYQVITILYYTRFDEIMTDQLNTCHVLIIYNGLERILITYLANDGPRSSNPGDVELVSRRRDESRVVVVSVEQVNLDDCPASTVAIDGVGLPLFGVDAELDHRRLLPVEQGRVDDAQPT